MRREAIEESRQLVVPIRIGPGPCQMPIEVRCAIMPPDRSPLAQRSLGAVDGLSGDGVRSVVSHSLGHAYGPAGPHQVTGQPLTVFRVEIGIGHAPEPPANDKIAAIGRDGIAIGDESRLRHEPCNPDAGGLVPGSPSRSNHPAPVSRSAQKRLNMTEKIIGAVAQKKVAQQTGAFGGSSGELLGVEMAALDRSYVQGAYLAMRRRSEM